MFFATATNAVFDFDSLILLSYHKKVKIKVTLEQTTKGQKVSRSIHLLFL
jgi:succinate dehydrogenase hydrophobic anchor subunit